MSSVISTLQGFHGQYVSYKSGNILNMVKDTDVAITETNRKWYNLLNSAIFDVLDVVKLLFND